MVRPRFLALVPCCPKRRSRLWRNSINAHKPSELTVDDYVSGILAGNRSVLARAITLAESQASKHREKADLLLQRLMVHTGKSKRIGITGVPGVGKSTFIEAMGCQLCSQGARVGVLTVDPASSMSGGSILGDKTRMEQLAQQPNAYIRPSTAGTMLGGVARRTREAMLLCEAAGFNVILVETVGVGQSESTVRSMVDFFLLMLLPGGGDELQGIKKGVVELSDALFVNKADGSNVELALRTQREYQSAVRSTRPVTRGWHTEVNIGSARTGEGLPELWSLIERFYRNLESTGFIVERRNEQARQWLRDLLREEICDRFFNDPMVRAELTSFEAALARKECDVAAAAKQLMNKYEERRNERDSKN